MSWVWTIPLDIKPSQLLQPALIRPAHLRAIVPTFRDWDEARITIDSLLACTPRPAEIVLVNDNSEPDPPLWTRRYPIFVVNYAGNRGPSHARNEGVRFESGRPIDWLYFTDTACMPCPPQPGPASGTVIWSWIKEGKDDGEARIQCGTDREQAA